MIFTDRSILNLATNSIFELSEKCSFQDDYIWDGAQSAAQFGDRN